MPPYELAEHILRHYWNGRAPVNVAAIARRHNILITQVPALSSIGTLTCAETKEPVLAIREGVDSRRMRFAIAHLLYRYLCNRRNIQDFTISVTEKSFLANTLNVEERNANFFAIHLLIPDQALDYYLSTQKTWTNNSLAAWLNVAPAALELKLKIKYPNL